METNNILKAAVLGAVAGFGLGYALGTRKNAQRVRELENSYEEDVANACAENREFFRAKERRYEEKIAELRVVKSDFETALSTYRGEVELTEAATEVAKIQYSDYDTTGMYTPELPPEAEERLIENPKPTREPYVDKSKPYVVTVDECLANEIEYSNSTITYYEGDDTLAGEEDEIFDDASRLLIVGMNLSNFGEKSGDENVVYIRNDKMHMYLEVIRNEGTYASQVAGLGDRE